MFVFVYCAQQDIFNRQSTIFMRMQRKKQMFTRFIFCIGSAIVICGIQRFLAKITKQKIWIEMRYGAGHRDQVIV